MTDQQESDPTTRERLDGELAVLFQLVNARANEAQAKIAAGQAQVREGQALFAAAQRSAVDLQTEHGIARIYPDGSYDRAPPSPLVLAQARAEQAERDLALIQARLAEFEAAKGAPRAS